MADHIEERLRDLENQNRLLIAENQRLKEHTDNVLTGIIAEGISDLDAMESIFRFTLEQVSLLKGIQSCAFCELQDNEAIILYSYSTFQENKSPADRIILSDIVTDALKDGSQVLTGDDAEAQSIVLKLEGSTENPKAMLLIPFSSRLIRQGILFLWDDNYSQDHFSQQITLLNRVLEIVVSRLDNLSLIQELQRLNAALNIEADRRVGELHETNEQLRETTLQRLRVEDALLRQRDIVSNISETSPVGITILNNQGQITYANDQAQIVLGLSKSQITERQFNTPEWKITDYDGNPFPENALPFSQVMRNKHPVYNVRHAIEWPNGKRVLLAINAAPLYDDEHQIDGVVTMVEDVTEQIAVDDEFRRLQNFNASIVQNISEGIVVQNQTGNITFVNPATAEILGYTTEEIIGKHWKDVVPLDQHAIVEAADERRKQGKTDHYELELRRKDGRRIQVRVSGSPRTDIRSDEFLGSLAVFSDISEQKYAENIRRVQRELAVQLSAAAGVDNVLRLCLNAAIQNTTMEVGGIYFVDQSTGSVRLEYAQGLSQEFLAEGAYYEADSENARLIAKGDPAYIDYADLKSVMSPVQINEELRAIAVLPIHHDGKVIACLNTASRTTLETSEPTKNILEMITTQIGSAVARAQAEDKLAQRVDQLKLINDIGEKIAAVLDLEAVLARTAHLIQDSFSYEHVALFIIDQQKKSVVMRTISGGLTDLFPKDHTLKLGQGIVGTAALQNETILANNVETDPHYVNLYAKSVHTRSELSVPIQIGGEVVGVIDAQSVKLNAFDENDIMVMETLADQVAVAIHNANLHESLRQELAERTRMEIALRDSEEKFRNIVEASPMGMHMYQLEPDDKLVFIDANPAADFILGVKCQQFVGKTIEEAFPALAHTEVPEKYRLAAADGEPWKTQQIEYAENQISGAFEVYAFQTSPGKMVTLFLDITERKQAEARNQQQMRRLAALSQIDAAITSNLSLNRTIEILLEQSIRQLEIDAAAILLFKPSTQTLEFYAGQGFKTEMIKTTRIRLGQNFAGRVALEQHTIRSTDEDIDFLASKTFIVEGFRTYFGVPLLAKGQIKGVLEVFHRSPLPPSEGWLSFLETVAGQAAIAIDNAELVENLERSNLELRLAYNTTLEGWAKALELRDFETQGHSNRVTKLTIQLASDVGIPSPDLVHVQRGALLHDIGKMAISDSILLKPGPLTDDEWKIMRQHPVYAYEMLHPIKFLRPALDIPYYHHEKWDGSGYPHGLKGEAIPLAARVFAIIDVWDALSSDRPYRLAWPETKIYEHIRSQVGKHFDPRVAEAFFSIIQSK